MAGTVSAVGSMKYSNAHKAQAAAAYRGVARRGRVLLLMVRLLRRLLGQNFGLGSKIDDLEAERIPSARLRIFRRFRVGVLNGRHPVREGFLGSGALARSLEIAHLREI